MMQNKVSARKTAVWWDLNTCHVPRDFDPYQIRRSIESAFKDHLPFTITATGNLNRIPHRVLEPIFSTGILIKHVLYAPVDIWDDMETWIENNPPPATLILISDHESVYVSSELFPSFIAKGYTILRAFANHRKVLPIDSFPTWFWKHILSVSEDTKQETSRNEVMEKCSETGWVCNICIDSGEPYTGDRYKSLIRHFKSMEHSFQEWSRVPGNLLSVNGATSKEWSRAPGMWLRV